MTLIPVENVTPATADIQIKLRFDLLDTPLNWVDRETVWEEICAIRANTRQALGRTP